MADLDSLPIPPIIEGVIAGEYEETEDDVDEPDLVDHLRNALEILKSNAHLLAFLSDPTLAVHISARERKLMDKQLDRMIPLIGEIDDALDEV